MEPDWNPGGRAPWWRRHWPVLVGLAGLLVLTYVLTAIFVVPAWIVSQTSPADVQPGDRIKAINDVRGQLLGILIPMAAAIAGTAAWFSLRTTQGQLEETRRQNERLFAITKQDQINERFSRATDQLGKHLDQRIGAIYALEQIARDEPGWHLPIMEVLTTFLRVHANREQDEHKPWPDVQVALTVIGRRDSSQDHGHRLNLSGTVLQGADLSEANLQGVDLTGADLRQVNLRGADLQGAQGLTSEQLNNAEGVNEARLPAYLRPAPESSRRQP